MRKPYHFTTQNPRFLYIDAYHEPFLSGGVPPLLTCHSSIPVYTYHALCLFNLYRIPVVLSFSYLLLESGCVLHGDRRIRYRHKRTSSLHHHCNARAAAREGVSEVLGSVKLLSPRFRLACGLLIDAPLCNL